ncbi:hypothetical protein MMPV_008546 [Pyropia vietnamensis]
MKQPGLTEMPTLSRDADFKDSNHGNQSLPSQSADVQVLGAADAPSEPLDVFEGPEKKLVLSFNPVSPPFQDLSSTVLRQTFDDVADRGPCAEDPDDTSSSGGGGSFSEEPTEATPLGYTRADILTRFDGQTTLDGNSTISADFFDDAGKSGGCRGSGTEGDPLIGDGDGGVGRDKSSHVDEAREGATFDLRSASREEWDAVLADARCTVLSVKRTADCDAYLLSESSLFVFARRVLIKTCGTTTLLRAIPRLLRLAARCRLKAATVTYSRTAFTFPNQQLYPHTSWAAEVTFLDRFFHGKAALVGTSDGVAGWHLYVAGHPPLGKDGPAAQAASVQTLEVFMFDLDPAVMAHFITVPPSEGGSPVDGGALTDSSDGSGGRDRGDGGNPAVGTRPPNCPGEVTTRVCRLNTLLRPGTVADAWNFEPCGYSMNGLGDSGTYYTVHITPESHCSYVSFECNVDDADLTPLLQGVLSVFRPGRVTVSVLADGHDGAVVGRQAPPLDWDAPRRAGYGATGVPMSQRLATVGGGLYVASVCSYTFAPEEAGTTAPTSLIRDAAACPLDVSASVKCLVDNDTDQRRLQLPIGCWGGGEESRADKAGVPIVGHGGGDGGSGHVAKFAFDTAVANVAAVYHATPVSTGDSVGVARETAARLEQPTFAVCLSTVADRYWSLAATGARLRYTVRCNPDPAVVALLAALGSDFEVSGLAELELLASVGVAHTRVTLAAVGLSRKLLARTAAGRLAGTVTLPAGVDRPTIERVAAYLPGVGVEVEVCASALSSSVATATEAVAAGLVLIGVRLDAPVAADVAGLRRAAACVSAMTGVARGGNGEVAPPLEVHLSGGFLSEQSMALLSSLCQAVDVMGDISVGAAPFVVGEAVTLAVTVIARRLTCAGVDAAGDGSDGEGGDCRAGGCDARVDKGGTESVTGGGPVGTPEPSSVLYYLNDGVYGAFNRVLLGGQSASPLDAAPPGRGCFPSVLFGPTCDSLDRVWGGCLPLLNVGDVLVFRAMGAYAVSAASSFNGFGRHFRTRYVTSHA